MTLWQFAAAVEGYSKANGGEKQSSITDDDMTRWSEG